MKQKILTAGILLLAGFIICAEEKPWQYSGKVEWNGNAATLIGKHGIHTAISTKRTFDQGLFQTFSFTAETTTPAEIIVQTTGFTDKNYDKYLKLPLPEGKSEIRFGFYTPEKKEITLRIYLPKDSPSSKIRIENPVFLAGGMNPPEYYLAGHAEDRLRTVSAEDHIEGGSATEFTPSNPNNSRLRTLDFCVMPGKKYVLKFWAKGDRKGRLTARADGWASKRKHFYVEKTFQLPAEYHEFEIEFTTPEDPDRYLGVMRLQLVPGIANKIFVKNVFIEERTAQ